LGKTLSKATLPRLKQKKGFTKDKVLFALKDIDLLTKNFFYDRKMIQILMEKNFLKDFVFFIKVWRFYILRKAIWVFSKFEKWKDFLVERLIFGRGKLTRPFIHSGMAALLILGMALAPLIASSGFAKDSWEEEISPSAVLSSAVSSEPQTTTLISEKPRAEIVNYTVKPGDTVSGIAKKFGISIDTIRWANNLESISSIKPGQVLKILPVTGVAHKVKKGETIYSIAKYYSTDPQGIVDFPFNTFSNDETFALAVGQILIVPDAVMPKETPWQPSAYIARKTPDAGTVVASGIFVWPASGTISQPFRWYHKGIDIANKAGPVVLAADAGKVILAGWPDSIGYGNRVIIDHGNGYQTLYAHLAKIYVVAGQTVKRGDQIGVMGSTGRSTGIHLHFEVHKNGVAVDPLTILR
jgi:murein DD-endopeptidase MepM/ murein hydrolase activator NlpD